METYCISVSYEGGRENNRSKLYVNEDKDGSQIKTKISLGQAIDALDHIWVFFSRCRMLAPNFSSIQCPADHGSKNCPETSALDNKFGFRF